MLNGEVIRLDGACGCLQNKNGRTEAEEPEIEADPEKYRKANLSCKLALPLAS